MNRVVKIAFVSVACSLFAIQSIGCAAAARTLGNIPSSGIVGVEAIDESGFPLDKDLWVKAGDGVKEGTVFAADKTKGAYKIYKGESKGDSQSWDTTEGSWIPLVRIGFRPTHTTSNRLLNSPRSKNHFNNSWTNLNNDRWTNHSVYVFIDVANAMRIPDLGARDLDGDVNPSEYRERLGKIAGLLIQAADRNGDVYWRNLTTFLEYVGALDSSAQAAQGAGIAASFLSPVLGAAIAGGGLAADAFVDDLTDSFNVESYAQLRDAVSTARQTQIGKIWDAVEVATPESGGFDEILRLTSDYAYSYSIKGALKMVKSQDEQLKSYLVTGESAWSMYFIEERIRYLQSKLGTQLSSAERTAIGEMINGMRDSLDANKRRRDEADNKARIAAMATKLANDVNNAKTAAEKAQRLAEQAKTDAGHAIEALAADDDPTNANELQQLVLTATDTLAKATEAAIEAKKMVEQAKSDSARALIATISGDTAAVAQAAETQAEAAESTTAKARADLEAAKSNADYTDDQSKTDPDSSGADPAATDPAGG